MRTLLERDAADVSLIFGPAVQRSPEHAIAATRAAHQLCVEWMLRACMLLFCGHLDVFSHATAIYFRYAERVPLIAAAQRQEAAAAAFSLASKAADDAVPEGDDDFEDDNDDESSKIAPNMQQLAQIIAPRYQCTARSVHLRVLDVLVKVGYGDLARGDRFCYATTKIVRALEANARNTDGAPHADNLCNHESLHLFLVVAITTRFDVECVDPFVAAAAIALLVYCNATRSKASDRMRVFLPVARRLLRFVDRSKGNLMSQLLVCVLAPARKLLGDARRMAAHEPVTRNLLATALGRETVLDVLDAANEFFDSEV